MVFPPELTACLALEENRVVVGRNTFAEPSISRHHFEISWDASIWRHVGEDLGSKNGTRIDGVPLSSAQRVIVDGAVIRMGGCLLVFESGDRPDDERVGRDVVPGVATATGGLRLRIARVAADPAPVLLSGETGTGKEQIAREIHRLSGRPGPFVAVSCAALEPELIESQLFGHGGHPGMFRSAQGGTLLLDEIGELPLALQPKLLRALQAREVLPVGDDAAVVVDVRVLAATNRDLPARVETGSFRRDLHARLALLGIAVPPLRGRRADILGWVARLHERWQAARPERRGGPLLLTVEAAEAIMLSPWPDNLRGVDRMVHRLAGARGEPAPLAEVAPHLPAAAAAPIADGSAPAPAAGQARIAAPTREELAQALEQNGGSIRAVARHYGRDRKQIYRWLKRWGMS